MSSRRVRQGLRLLLALAVAAALAAPVRAEVYMTRDAALAQAFPGAKIQARSYVLTEAQRTAAQNRAKVRIGARTFAAHVAWRGDTLAGVAFLDTRIVRTMPGTFLIVVAPDSTVVRVDVLAFHEPPDYRPPHRWLDLFGGRRLDEGLWARRDIRNLSGATLSARAVTEATRAALALYETVVAPDLAARPRAKPEAR